MKNPFRTWLDRRAAVNTYWSLAAEHAQLRHHLAAAADHTVRAQLLNRQAVAYAEQAEASSRAYGDEPIPDTRMTYADSLRRSGALCQLLADAEQAIADHRPRAYSVSDLEPVAGPLLDRMVTAGRMTPLLRANLARAVAPVTGTQAAKTVLRMPLVPVDGAA